MDKKEFDELRHRRIEYIVAAVFTIYAICGIVIVWDTKAWWVSLPILAFLVVVLMTFITRVKTFSFRAKLYAAMLEISILLYVMNDDSIINIVAPLMGLVVVLGLLDIPELLLVHCGFVTIAFIYHILFKHSIQFGSRTESISNLLQFASVYMVSLVVYVLLREQEKSRKRLTLLIDELRVTQLSKDNFLANVSHELRTPINTICGLSEIAIQNGEEVDIQSSMRDINAAGRDLMSSITDILDFTELEAGKMTPINENYLMEELIADVVNLTEPKASRKNLAFVVDVDPSVPRTLSGDEQKIRRVLLSILDNAVKFTSHGFVKMKVVTRAEEYGVNLHFTITDTGIGIRHEDLDKIFADFTQADGSRSRGWNGIGLGLSIAQAIAEIMGGFITVASQEGHGTRVEFVVPQTVVDSDPIAYIDRPSKLSFCTYFNLDRFEDAASREVYGESIARMLQLSKIRCLMCMTFKDLKNRMSLGGFTHLFIGLGEYRADKEYYDELSGKIKIIVLIPASLTEPLGNKNLFTITLPSYTVPMYRLINRTIEGQEDIQTLTQNKQEPSGRLIIPNARVLMVDDTAMNLKVLEGLLKPYECSYDTAESGAAALELVQNNSYDLILMDHMMPEMDGIECMHRIRALDIDYCHDVPIVVVTANAVAGMRENFIAEGFADFIAKPVDVSLLDRTLRRLIPEDKRQYTTEEVTEANDQQMNSGEDMGLGDLDTSKGLLYCGGLDNYIDVLRMHVRDGKANMAKIQGFYDSMDVKNYTILVHAVKSSMMSIGAVHLSEMAKALEAAGKKADTDYITANHIAMMTEYNRIIELLKSSPAVAGDQAEEENLDELTEITFEEFDSVAQSFEDAVYTFEPDAMYKVLDEIMNCKLNDHALKHELEIVKKKIDMSDYMSASSALQAIKDRCR